MYFQIPSLFIYNDYPKLKSIFGFWSQRQTMQHVLSHLIWAALQDDIIANFHFQRLDSYWQRLSQSLQIFIDRLWRLTPNFQNQKHKIQSNIL